jgi:hypothetical protein
MAPYASTAAKKRLQQGIKKMNLSLTPAQRVRRKILAGRPAASNREFAVFRAFSRLIIEADRAQELMYEERLDQDDIRAALVAEVSDSICYYWLPKPGKLAPYLALYEALVNPLFLGILWVQKDRDQKEDQWSGWFTSFTRDPRDHEYLTAARDAARKEAAKLNSSP